MQSLHAFAPPCISTPPLLRISTRSRITPRKPRSHPIPPQSLLRRRRVRGNAENESRPNEAAPEKEPHPPSESEETDDSEDTVLPNLKELFATGGAQGCEQCNGKGEIPCPVCEATGFVSLTMLDTVSSSQCRMCRGGREVPCPSCRQVVYKSVVWWDKVPSEEEDPEQKWRFEGGDDEAKITWGDNPANPGS